MAELGLRSMSVEINKIQGDIEVVNDIKQNIITSLENEKREIKEITRISIDKTDSELRKEIEDIIKSYANANKELDTNKMSMTDLDQLINLMDKQISKLESERVNAITDLENKQKELMTELESIEKLELLINALTYKIYELGHTHRKKIDALTVELNTLKERTDLTENEMAVEIENLEKKINDVTASHKDVMKSMELQKIELSNESEMKMSKISSVLKMVHAQREQFIKEYEQQLFEATPSESEIIKTKIARLKAQITEETRCLKNSEEKMLTLLEEKGMRLTPSGRFLTDAGQLYTYDEVDRLGLLSGISKSKMERIFKCYTTSNKTSTMISSSSSTRTWDSDMAPEDVHYLKKTIATPLVLALADVAAKQPRDPIHYLAHWLIKYRYNQEIDAAKKNELNELLMEREKLAAEKLHRELEEEARAVLWDMIIRAEQEVLRRQMEAELLRIALEAEMMEEDFLTNDFLEQAALDEEARDTLGVYNGPTTNRRVWDQKFK